MLKKNELKIKIYIYTLSNIYQMKYINLFYLFIKLMSISMGNQSSREGLYNIIPIIFNNK